MTCHRSTVVLPPSMDGGGPRRLSLPSGILQLRCCLPHTCVCVQQDRRPSRCLIISPNNIDAGIWRDHNPSVSTVTAPSRAAHSHGLRVSRYIPPLTATPPPARGRVPSSWLPVFCRLLASLLPSVDLDSCLSLQCSAPRLPHPSLITRASRSFKRNILVLLP
ncbi:hypothetical protein OH76DRAFT_988209 [Lentinus brumalis]|uniref:Uncharacterized protein n=1 Tax=Lentinus brumalis TaxID=2498619 RepID=A0A371DQ76_9APHY|nr:hypothetical protein OH76DRAFT_988209 [Polyporus brumalis]